MGVGAFYCAYSPSVCHFTENILRKMGQSSKINIFDYETALLCILWLPDFLLLMPIIIGQIADTIGIVSMIIPFQIMTLCGQVIMMLCYYFADYYTDTQLIAFLGYFFISIGFKGVKLTQIILLANTFICVNGNLVVFQKISIASFLLNGIFQFGSIFWSNDNANTDLLPSEILGVLLCLTSLFISWMVISSGWIKNNTENLDEQENSLSLMWSHDGKEPTETFSYLNDRTINEMPSESSRALTKLKNLGASGLLIMLCYCCYIYLLDTIAFYFVNVFLPEENSSEVVIKIINFMPGLVLVAVQISFLFFPLSKILIERLVLGSCILLAISMLLTNIVGWLSLVLFVVALAMHPFALLLYLPHIVKKKIQDSGFIIGLFMWLEALVNSFGVGLVAKYGEDTAKLTKFGWGNPYFFVLVIAYVSAIVLSVVLFIYRIYVRREAFMEIENLSAEKNGMSKFSQNVSFPKIYS